MSRRRVLRTAVAIADAGGVKALTMRRLADRLGVEAMSLYYHVRNKEDLLDGALDVVVDEINDAVNKIDISPAGAGWKQAVRARILTSREILLRHPWAPAVFETRSSLSLAVVRYHDGLVGLMRAGGFPYDRIHHALHALGSRALGFSQELFRPGDGAAGGLPEDAAAALPNLAAMLGEIAHDDPGSTLGWCDDQNEFEFAVDLLLDGLDRMRETAG